MVSHALAEDNILKLNIYNSSSDVPLNVITEKEEWPEKGYDYRFSSNALSHAAGHRFLSILGVSAGAREVYESLTFFLQYDTGKMDVFPNIETLCSLSGLSKNGVLKSIKSLEKIGLLKVERNSGISNKYKIISLEELYDKQFQQIEYERKKSDGENETLHRYPWEKPKEDEEKEAEKKGVDRSPKSTGTQKRPVHNKDQSRKR